MVISLYDSSGSEDGLRESVIDGNNDGGDGKDVIG